MKTGLEVFEIFENMMEKYHANHINDNAPNYCPLCPVYLRFCTYIYSKKILPVFACTQILANNAKNSC